MKNQTFLKTFILCDFILLLSVFGNNKLFSQTRQEISLNGVWDFKWDNERRLTYPPDGNGWTNIEVTRKSRTETGFGQNGTNHWAWYKRNITVPNSMKGQRIKVRFTIVKYKAYIYWNGQKVSEHQDGETPFEIDVTDKVKFNAENELLVGVIDRLSWQRPDLLPYQQSDFAGTEPIPPFGSILGPTSNTERIFGGICDDVDLISYPFVHIEDFHITTLVRRSEISVETTVLNEDKSQKKYDLKVFIEDKGNKIKEFPKESLTMDPGKETNRLFVDNWEKPHLWSYKDPYLYTMVMQVLNGKQVVDEKRFKFGFREYWIEGTNFYLNGKVFEIRTTPIWSLRWSAEEIKKWMEELKAGNINQIRIHSMGYPERIATIVYEVGITICPESTFYSRTPYYDIENPEMWKNAMIHWAGLVKEFKNHPSVVMYSIENEMLSTGAYLIHQDPDKWRNYQDKWIEIDEYVRSLDPTKPLQHSWGHDIHGYLETANIHYVRDIKYFFQYPNDLYWLEGENLTQLERNYDFKWLKDKPLIKGEYEYWYHSNPPHGLTSFIGEEAYEGDHWTKAWKWAIKKKMEVYRYSGIIASPEYYGTDRYQFFPLQEVYLKDWKANFYSGDDLRKEIIVVNKDIDPISLQLEINLVSEGKVLSQKSISLDLEDGSKWMNDVSLILPETDKRINAALKLKLVKDGKELYSNEYPVHIFPGIKPVKYNISSTGLYDPDGKSFREMTSSGFYFKRINDIGIKELTGLEILIIGKDAIKPQFREKGKILDDFVRKGGRLIILEQSNVEKFEWLPFELDIDKTQLSATTTIPGRIDQPTLDDITMKGLNSTIAFKMIPDHPLLKDIESEDLRYWHGTHQVAKNNFIRPRFWNYNTIAYVGSGDGIMHTPLVTLPYGKGLFIMTQFIISEEMSKEPAAFILFNNMLKYAGSYTAPVPSKAGVFGVKNNSIDRIITLFGAKADNLQKFPMDNLTSYKVLFIDGNINLDQYKNALNNYMEGGGKIILRELTPEKLNNVKCILPDDISLNSVPSEGPVNVSPNREICPTAYKVGFDPILAGITNFEFYWRTPSTFRVRFGQEIAPIAKYSVTGKNIIPLTEPAIFAKFQAGKGEVIFDQIDWTTGLNKATVNTCRIISNLLNNLGIDMQPNITFNQ